MKLVRGTRLSFAPLKRACEKERKRESVCHGAFFTPRARAIIVAWIVSRRVLFVGHAFPAFADASPSAPLVGMPAYLLTLRFYVFSVRFVLRRFFDVGAPRNQMKLESVLPMSLSRR